MYNLPEDYTGFFSPVCRKLRGITTKQCRVDCAWNIYKHLLNSKEPFEQVCHAGLHLLIVPVPMKTGLPGFFILGPSAGEDSECKYQENLKYYKMHAIYNAEEFEKAKHLLIMLANNLYFDNNKSMTSSHIANKSDAPVTDQIAKIALSADKTGAKHLNVAALAKKLGMSKSHFRYVFKLKTGVPIAAYLRNSKIERAKKLLKETKLKTASISRRLGYKQECSFFEAFKKATKMTPAEFRAK
jgi:AraC-like DNA-binding protein